MEPCMYAVVLSDCMRQRQVFCELLAASAFGKIEENARTAMQ